ncbi:hypothetical protein DPMN_138128 [Dreissena polymorpha]|uniref:Uncharacterized protein n=1 Tax=Dreissena polymorpha TaxID=45954 RepID=A0A9D4JFB7_DREPO|nr:hypothetical protein DPMN_138128 [Dreissena polymorpha]
MLRPRIMKLHRYIDHDCMIIGTGPDSKGSKIRVPDWLYNFPILQHLMPNVGPCFAKIPGNGPVAEMYVEARTTTLLGECFIRSMFATEAG